MIILKYIIMCLVLLISILLGNIISKRYVLRVKELKDFENALNIIESKIKFTYEPLPEIFIQTSKLLSENISNIFKNASNYMKELSSEEAWNKGIEKTSTYLNKEDIENIKCFGKMLGKTDKEGQISQLELTKTFIGMQIKKAKEEEEKNSKLYKTLGVVCGLALVIVLI